MDMFGFDMIAAITQDTVNFQFHQLYRRGILPKRCTFASGNAVSLEATLDAPTVHLGVADNRRSALFRMNILSGTLQYWDFSSGEPTRAEMAIEDWAYAFRVNLDFETIERSQLQQSKAVPDVVKQHLEGFSSEMMSIRHLFMNFQDANLADYDRNLSRVVLPGGEDVDPSVLGQLQMAFSNYFRGLKGADNPYVMGYVLNDLRPTPQRLETFAPRSSLFSTFVDPKIEGLNTLNFLMITDLERRPVDPSGGLLSTNLVKSNDYDGRFVISKDLFWNRWFIPKLKEVLEIRRGENGAWRTDHQRGVLPEFDYDDGDFRLIQSPEVNFLALYHESAERNSYPYSGSSRHAVYTKIGRNTNTVVHYRREPGRIVFDIRVYMFFSFHFYGPQANENANGLAPIVGREIYQEWVGTLELSTAKGVLALILTDHRIENQRTTNNNNLTGELSVMFSKQNQATIEGVEKDLQRLADGLTGSLTNLPSPAHYLVLPAGDVFFFKDLHLDDGSNIAMNITYKS